jgi:hypothetical protein
MTPVRLRVFNVASHQNVTRVSVAVETSDTETSVEYCDFINREPRALVNLVVDESELAIWLARHDGRLHLREILEAKLGA